MSNQLQIFNNPKFGKIRTVEVDGETKFIASDIAKALGYVNPRKAISDHCRWVTKRDVPHPQSPDKTIEVNVIPKGDIYRLAANSELPGAREFESWIFDEVLISIDSHGTYMTPDTIDKVLADPDFGIRLLSELKKEREEKVALQNKVEQDVPKVLFADAVSASKATILIGELAKLIKQNGVDIGEKRLFKWLRNNKYLISRYGTDYNAPTQKSMELELFTVKETTITHSDGHITVSKTTKVTGKGQQYFINKFLTA